MKKQIVTVVLVFLLFAGCAPTRQAVIETSTKDTKNIEAIREVSERCRKDWLVKSGFLDGLLGSRKEELPKEVIDAKEKLDQLAEQQELSDYELGLFLGLKVRLSGSVIQTALEKYAPDAGLLPFAFLLQ